MVPGCVWSGGSQPMTSNDWLVMAPVFARLSCVEAIFFSSLAPHSALDSDRSIALRVSEGLLVFLEPCGQYPPLIHIHGNGSIYHRSRLQDRSLHSCRFQGRQGSIGSFWGFG